MDQSSRLSLPYLLPAQAQKHVTYNTALERLDVFVQLVVEAFEASVPPLAPEDGQVWALGANPTQDWAGQAGMLAAWLNGAWQFFAPGDGWQAVGRATGELRLRTAAGWDVPPLPDLQNLDGVGIGSSWDATNRLAISSAATLLTHAGAGHQLKVNKNAVTDTASLLFQTGWSGRAEMGTTGADDFTIKVSPDGTAFQTGLSLDPATGAAAVLDGLTIGGATAFHQGNLVGPVSQSGGTPAGAVIEHGSNANGSYTRWADGTQICWVSSVDMGSILAAGTGSWNAPYRTNPLSLTWPIAFSATPTASATLAPGVVSVPLDARAMTLNAFAGPDALGWDFLRASRIGSSSFDTTVLLSVIATGRWF